MERMVTVLACPHCVAQRLYPGNCSFCNTPLHEQQIELPELSSFNRETAERYLEVSRTGNVQS